MFHLKKFDTYRDYKEYLQGDDIYLPRVSLIINAGDKAISVDRTNSEYGPTWLDFKRAGTKFVEIINGGVMKFTDLYAVDNLFDYIAVLDENEVLHLHVYYTGTTNELTESDTTYYDTYAIKRIDDTIYFPQIYGVTKSQQDELLEENLFYLDDIAKLDTTFVLG